MNIIEFLKYEFSGKSLWEWAKEDGWNIKESYFLPTGYTPADIISRSEWDKIKPSRSWEI